MFQNDQTALPSAAFVMVVSMLAAGPARRVRAVPAIHAIEDSQSMSAVY
jgi:hypothetical protein